MQDFTVSALNYLIGYENCPLIVRVREDDIWLVIYWKGTKTSILVSLDLANMQWSEHDSCI